VEQQETKKLRSWHFAESGQAMRLAQLVGYLHEEERRLSQAKHGLTHSAAIARMYRTGAPGHVAGAIEAAIECASRALLCVQAALDDADGAFLRAVEEEMTAEERPIEAFSANDLANELLRRGDVHSDWVNAELMAHLRTVGEALDAAERAEGVLGLPDPRAERRGR
jgi:hypothetical protein